MTTRSNVVSLAPKRATADNVDTPLAVENAGLVADALISASAFMGAISPENLPIDGREFKRRIAGKVDAIRAGDLRPIQEMLMGDAELLHFTFHLFLAEAKTGSQYKRRECMDMALRAQARSRRNLVALADLRKPRRSVNFIRRQNNTQVNTQVRINARRSRKRSPKRENQDERTNARRAH